MQTFLTFFNTTKVFQNLDRVRHSKQRSEAIHILESNLGIREGYKHHPALPMWQGYEPWLASYALMCCHSYRMQYGFEGRNKYNYFDHIVRLIDEFDLTRNLGERMEALPPKKEGGKPRKQVIPGIPRPGWRYDTDFLTSHRSNLIRKDPELYRGIFGDYPDNYPYLWPENDSADNGYILRVSKADRDRLRKGERVLPDNIEIDWTDGIVL